MEHEKIGQCNEDKSSTPTIFPLSPNPQLELPQLHMYRKYLKAAFDEPRISNIAITGGFGIGKSSIVRSLEQSLRKKKPEKFSTRMLQRIQKITPDCILQKIRKIIPACILQKIQKIIPALMLQKIRLAKLAERAKESLNARKAKKESCKEPGFLYVSLGSFASTPDREETAEKEQSEKKKNDNQELNMIERRLLLQVYARFHRQDIPLSGFRLIPEAPKKRLAILCGLVTCSILLLLFHEMLGRLLVVLSTNNSIPPSVREFLGLMVSWKPHLHLLLYAFVIATASLAVAMICFRVLPRLRLSSVALKASNAEVALEKETCESYLDLYSMELVYCLEQLVDKIDSTIVFEDFDRLSSDVYIQIFTRLREINYMVNLRLKALGKRIRFIYVINDSLLGDIVHPKFFDYILPVIPYLNQKSAETVLIKRLKTISEVVGFGENSVRNVERVAFQLAPHLADFRLQNTVLNEYSLLSELYKEQNSEHLDDYDAAHLFAFAIYKNAWPNDYQDLLLGKSRVFGLSELRCPDDMERYDLLKLLTDPKDPLLTSHCFYYAGFSELEVANMRRNRWQKVSAEEIIRDIETIQAAERYNLVLVRKHCVDILNREYCACINDAEVVAATIRCMVRCNQTDNSWFFNGDKLKKCLYILSKLEDESVKRRFFELTAVDNQENIYDAPSVAISELHEITQAEFVELCRGIKQFAGDISLRVDGILIDLREDHPFVEQARRNIQG